MDGNTWYQERLDGNEGDLWRKARYLFLFNKTFASALNLFDLEIDIFDDLPRPIAIREEENSRHIIENADQPMREQSWTAEVKQFVRILLDRIVTRWKPEYMNVKRISIQKLHESLTPVPLEQIPSIFGKAQSFD
ncbi:unnamed protein product [Didymodactylos carnosus]|uniref:Uncharacterized protein n=1 Tax=Didymodactylos carnosus TaxID=1234261 RepID=A0A815BKK8_9BILA|nr:unnamed protein product [Didymodactylos carnosus]CAF1273973.1 unnamed protein product [Didymodactylos carnosus]CAF4055588.1 unnamed protein product [Didymodactylos carnosus]CAF4063901.1 unnamed protein product [Didymodactylos carnosus]